MNKDKSIKDLKKRNDSLKMQYEYRNIRCITLEKRIESYEQQIQKLTNNWNELEEWLIDYRTNMDNPDIYEEGIIDCLDEILDKMKEIQNGGNYD